MKMQDLTPEQQRLVATDFGEMDKVAEAAVGHARECYAYGFDKLAAEIADAQDAFVKQAEEDEKKEKEEKKEELDEHGEKTAAESGAFIEQGTYDGLQKLGQERHGDPFHYFYPYMEQKVAEAGATAALEKAAGVASRVAAHARETAGHARAAVTGRTAFMDKMNVPGKMHRAQQVAEAGKAAKGAVPYAAGAAAAGGAGVGGHHLFGKKREKQETAAANPST